MESEEEALQKRYEAIEAGIVCSYLPELDEEGSIKKQLGQWFIRKRGIKILTKQNEWVDVVGPNKKCHCGSGCKYKMCCLNEDFDLLDAIISSGDKKAVKKKPEEP